MADETISDLAAASAALGTHEIPVNESGVSKKLTVAQIAAFSPGHEIDYVETTGTVHITAATEDTATTIVTGNAITYGGSTAVCIEFFAPVVGDIGSSLAYVGFYLYDGSGSIGQIAQIKQAETAGRQSVHAVRRLTPSNASHVYSIRGEASAIDCYVYSGAGGHGASVPGFIRITKV